MRLPRPSALAAMLVTLVLAAGLVACTPQPGGVLGGLLPGHPAPELVGLTDWQNSPPLTLASLREQKRVVLIDFWTYTCVNCIRTLPYLRQWHERYASAGLTIIGVHAPEFDFEKDPANVKRAVEADGIKWPIAQDNEMKTWDAFNNNAWPAKYLITAEGQIPYTHIGEGAYDQTEQQIRAALTAAGHDVSKIASGGLPEPTRDPKATMITRELYGGFERNYQTRGAYAAQKEYYDGGGESRDYIDPKGARADNVWYLQGRWRAEREAIAHARETQNLEDYLAFRFTARSVNVVMQPRTPGASYVVVVEIDGRPLRRQEAGADVTFDAQGRSIVTVDTAKMYSIMILPALGVHEAKLRSNSADFAMYAVTFGINTSGA